MHPEISELLLDEENLHIEYLERRIGKEIVIKPQEGFHLEQYAIAGV